MEAVDRAHEQERRALALIETAWRQRFATRSGGRESEGTCSLCGDRVIRIDWRPRLPWIAVEGCSCAGFFVRADLLEGRLQATPLAERATLRVRVLGLRALGREAWLTTADGQVDGPLVILTERPDRLP